MGKSKEVMTTGTSGVPHTGVAVRMVARAHRLISKCFPSPWKSTYLRGKTELRDLLYDELECSLLEAETLVDALERNQKIRFEKSRTGSRFGTWTVGPAR
mgnify:CR=1 FL=1